MSAADSGSLAWFPLVPRPRPPCPPLETRVRELTALAAGEHGDSQEHTARAAEVLNKAALIASDCGVPGLARQLCDRQYELFARAAPLPARAVRLALQPVLNIPRQLIRDRHGDEARAMLEALHQAARSHAGITIDGLHVSFGTLTRTADGYREARTLTWTALLADGTRALARAGRWQEAAEHAAAHRGTGTRLLDGRQAAILALLTSGQISEAADMTAQSAPAEGWEQAVQAVLRVLCQRAAGQEPDIATMTGAACALARTPDPATIASRTRIGLTALNLSDGTASPPAPDLRTALITAAHADGYAARDLLASPLMSKSLTTAQGSRLRSLARACGLGAGTIPGHLNRDMTTAASRAASTLAAALAGTSEAEAR